MRHFGEHKNWKNEIVLLHSALTFGKRNLHWMMLVKDPQHRAGQQENQKKRKNYNCTQGQRFAAIGHVFAGEHALDDELLRAVR